MDEMICLDKNYSTTRLLTRKQPSIENRPEDKFESMLFLPEGEGRQGEGGLRTQGYFKTSQADKPLITVITVVYNGEQFLEETIQSIINQTYDNVEYIVIDGGSTDGTLDIIRKYEHAIDYWVSEEDQGIYHAMNKGIALATNDGWSNFMNAGDVFFSRGVLEEIRFSLKDYDLVYGNHSIYNDKMNSYQVFDVGKNKGNLSIPFCHQALFVKTILLKNTLFNVNYKVSADFDQYLRLIDREIKVKHVNLTVVKYLDGGVSAVLSKELIRECFDISKKYFPISASIVFLIRKFKIFMLRK